MTNRGAPRRDGLWLDGLTPEQREVACARDRAQVVVAGPGTGKTRALVARVADLLMDGVPPEEVLVCCFTRAACSEFRARLEGAVGLLAGLVPVRTIFDVATDFYPEPQGGWIDDDTLAGVVRGLFDGALRDARAGKTTVRAVRDALRRVAVDDPPPGGAGGAAMDLARAALHRCHGMGCFPMSMVASRANYERQKAGLAARSWAHVIVDEGHDCSKAEVELALGVAGQTFTLVMDPRQAIYEWRTGMGPAQLEQFVGSCRGDGTPGLVVRHLTCVFRFGAALCAEANRRSGAGEREALWPAPSAPAGEAPPLRTIVARDADDAAGAALEDVVGQYIERYGPSEVAVVCRTNRQARWAFQNLPSDLTTLVRGTTEEMGKLMLAAGCALKPDMALPFVRLAASQMPPLAVPALMARLGDQPSLDAYRAARAKDEVMCLPVADALPPVEEARTWTLQALCAAVFGSHEGKALFPDALNDLGLLGARLPEALPALYELSDAPDSGLAITRPMGRVPVLTVHGAKGREWDAVVYVRAEPPRDGEDERIDFVAVTRARKAVTILDNHPRRNA